MDGQQICFKNIRKNYFGQKLGYPIKMNLNFKLQVLQDLQKQLYFLEIKLYKAQSEHLFILDGTLE